MKGPTAGNPTIKRMIDADMAFSRYDKNIKHLKPGLDENARARKNGVSRVEVPVFDRGKKANTWTGHGAYYVCRRTAADAVPPRQVVTAAIMGDPAPGRSAQDKMGQGL